MADLYFGIKVFGLSILCLFGFIVFMLLTIQSISSIIREKRIVKYLTSIGYKRELISTAAFGDNHHYGYTRPRGDGWNDVIHDSELTHLSISKIKKKYM